MTLFMKENLRIVVVAPELHVTDPGDENAALLAERSRQLRIGLLEGGYNLVAVLPADVFLQERLTQLMPDMVIVDAKSDARDTLEHVVVATREAPRPVVLFTEEEDPLHMKSAVAAGVSAYVVAGLAAERIRPVLNMALARFEHEQDLRKELAQARNALQDRKLIERAKGVLMDKQQCSEDHAYAKLRKAAMDKGLRMVDMAQRIMDAHELLG
jgi:response regulator NasT